ncbi:MAG: NAD(P)-dependent oxidoreductase [Candidatus Omnitrophica bacterium]|nr:NAD(P)-dependent oxidoreductase [Candidatus Omnitrophota bacterium]
MVEVVVTGASGFIGRAVCAELAARGVSVMGVGRSADPEIRGVPYVRVAGYEEFRPPRNARCLHLACSTRFREGSMETHPDCFEAVQLVRAILHQGYDRVVLASSALVYGDHVPRPRREDEPVQPTGAYARMKLAVETEVLACRQTVARLSNVYGPRMQTGTALSDILQQLPDSAAPLRVRDTSPVRDYLYLEDAGKGLADLVLAEEAEGIVNLGTGIGTSVGELARQCLVLAGQADRPVVGRHASERISTVIVDPGKAARQLGWRAERSLVTGLKGMVEPRTQQALHAG